MSKSKGINKDRTKDKISRRELLKMAAPLGKVEIDRAQCTGCGLCALECPTEALTALVGEDDIYQLLFKHTSCVACRQCIEICPEKCLNLERTLELDRINQPAAVLFEDRIVRCRECGSPIGTEAMINKLRERLPTATGPSQFELCPDCKIKVSLPWK